MKIAELKKAESLQECLKLESLLNKNWLDFLMDSRLKEIFNKIETNLMKSKKSGAIIYPPTNLLFNAFNLTSPQFLKVVILGQDPYHNKNEAMGLSFSVPLGVRIPPSLRNIFKELSADIGILTPYSGDLTSWAAQGVLLLNSILSVEENKPSSHKSFGWQEFSDFVLTKISKNCDGVVFLLWGNYAKGKKDLIDLKKHFVLEAAHPSPLARSGFLGCGHFSKTNEILKTLNKAQIDWNLN